LRIIICCNAYPPNFIGGAELIAHYQAKALVSLGHEVIVFAGEGENRQYPRYTMTETKFDGLTVYRVGLSWRDYDPRHINFIHSEVEAQFCDLIHGFRPQIVHFHNIVGLSVGLINVAYSHDIKTVLTLHDAWGFCFKNTLIKKGTEICTDFSKCAECMDFVNADNDIQIPIQMRKDFIALQLGKVDILISPSHYLAKTYGQAGFSIDRIRVLENGIDVHRFQDLPRDPSNGYMRFTFVGNFAVHKGVEVLLKALKLIPSKDKVRINLVGDGTEKNKYLQYIEDKKLIPYVKLWGKVENSRIEEVYRETDVLVLPSIWPENQPVSITEAMAASIPVIGSDIGGIPELVRDGKTGYVFEPSNAGELANKMLEFVQSPGKVATFGQASFAAIRNKSFASQVGRLLSIYAEVKMKRSTENTSDARNYWNVA
jgi:glycosyltransferase involved in cell wall biosynthesis